MNQKHRGANILSLPWYMFVLLIIFLLLLVVYWAKHCRQTAVAAPVMNSSKDGRVSWNILFKPGTGKAARDSAVERITKYADSLYLAYNAAKGTNYKADSVKVYTCPCDTLLYNYDFLAIDGSGKSVTTTPPPPPTVPGSGDSTGALVSGNPSIDEPVRRSEVNRGKFDSVVQIRGFRVDNNTTLAIIDSGIDTTLFSTNVTNLFWTDADPAKTMYNFLPGANIKDRFDDTKNWHGSAVAAIAVKAIEGQVAAYPKLMILKALDKDVKGTVFSVSCALSYAIQKKASLINLSLGYYGTADSVLRYYLALSGAGNSPVEVFAAAGNTKGTHTDDSLCNSGDNHNLLSNSRLFYPACFSKELTNITGVTQISQKDSACFYQNYSNEYIQLGVFNKNYCCATRVDYLPGATPNFYEGSSFATPVASGLRISCMLQPSGLTASTWGSLVLTNKNLDNITIGGKYIEYTQPR